MSPRPTTTPQPNGAGILVLAGILVMTGACGSSGDGPSDALMQTVMTSDLQITVRERAELQAQTDTRVISQLEGRNTLIYLIPEGTVAKKGDKLAELDAGLIAEKRANHAVVVTKADAMVKQARKNYEVMEKELLAAERTAASRLKIANIRVAKFLGQANAKGSKSGGAGFGGAGFGGTGSGGIEAGGIEAGTNLDGGRCCLWDLSGVACREHGSRRRSASHVGFPRPRQFCERRARRLLAAAP